MKRRRRREEKSCQRSYVFVPEKEIEKNLDEVDDELNNILIISMTE